MLTDEKKLQNKRRYCELLKKAVKDDAAVLEYLNSIKYFDAPATAQYTGAYAGGLCEQALKLAHELGVLCNAYFPGRYTEEDVLKVALFKEVYRAQMYEVFKRNVKNEESGVWEPVFSFRTKEDRPVYGDLGFSSYMTLRKYVDFTDEQLEAIIHSTGLNNLSVDIHEILRAYPLVTLTRMASEATTYLLDTEK